MTREGPRVRRSAWVAPLAIVAAGSLGVARLSPRLAAQVHAVKERDAVTVLPPAADLRPLTLGYHAAAVDLLWAKLLVDYGTAWQEKRPYDARPAIDAILALEPTYAPVYRFVDTLLVYRPPRGDEDDARDARRYLERGTRERPGDAAVWLELGQFVAFIGPSFLSSPEEKARWRRDGAEAIAEAVERGAEPDRMLAAASILGRAGERAATITYLQHAYALADDPQTRAEIAAKLARLSASAAEDAIGARWKATYPFLSRGLFLLLGPARDPARCVGLASAEDTACATDWSTWLGAAP